MMETTTPKLKLITSLPFTADVMLFVIIAFSVLGVLIGLLALNLFYKFFLEGFYPCKRTQNRDPQVIEVVVNNATDQPTENTEKSINTQDNEKSIEMQEKINVNELIAHISK